jgi:hypothetical protein
MEESINKRISAIKKLCQKTKDTGTEGSPLPSPKSTRPSDSEDEDVSEDENLNQTTKVYENVEGFLPHHWLKRTRNQRNTSSSSKNRQMDPRPAPLSPHHSQAISVLQDLKQSKDLSQQANPPT